MVVIRPIRDRDIDFGNGGHIQIRGHPSGGYKGILVIKVRSSSSIIETF